MLMSLSTIVVALNAQLLRRLDLSPQASVTAARGAPKVQSSGPPPQERAPALPA